MRGTYRMSSHDLPICLFLAGFSQNIPTPKSLLRPLFKG